MARWPYFCFYNMSVEILRRMIYNMPIFIFMGRSSSVTIKQTNKQTNGIMFIIYKIYILAYAPADHYTISTIFISTLYYNRVTTNFYDDKFHSLILYQSQNVVSGIPQLRWYVSILSNLKETLMRNPKSLSQVDGAQFPGSLILPWVSDEWKYFT